MTEADGRPGQWYLHLYDTRQPDWNWDDKDVPALPPHREILLASGLVPGGVLPPDTAAWLAS